MKKYLNIAMILGLAEVSLQSGLFGNKNYAKLDAEQLDQLDQALAKNLTTDLEAQIAQLNQEKTILEQKSTDLQATVDQLEGNLSTIENALEQALTLNEVEAAETMEGSIVALGEMCKTYGDSKNHHTLVPIDGSDVDPSGEGLLNGIVNPNDSHNKIS